MTKRAAFLKWGVILLTSFFLFALDVMYVLGASWGLKYLFLVFLSLWIGKKGTAYWAAGIGSVCIILDAILPGTIVEHARILTEKSLSVLVLWVVAFVTERRFNHAKTFSSRTNRFFAIATLLFLSIVVIFTNSYHHEGQKLKDAYLDNQHDTLRIAVKEKKKAMADLFTDISFLQNFANVKHFKTHKADLQNDFAAFIRMRPEYDQIRVLDTNGQEIVRINQGTDGHIVSEELLQDKSGRDYFKQTKQLKDGQYYLSDISLNQEHGKISLPRKSVIRIVTPIVSKRQKQGILVINYLPFVSTKTALHKKNKIQILDQRGYWFQGVPQKMLFGYKKDFQSDSIKRKLPTIWNELSAKSSGRFNVDGSTILFEQIRWTDLLTENPRGISKSTILASKNSFIFLKEIPSDVMFAVEHKHAFSYGLFFSLLVLVLFFIGISLFEEYIIFDTKSLKNNKLEQEIIANIEQFKEMQHITKLGTWRIVLDEMRLEWDEMTYQIHEIPYGTPIDIEKAIDFYREEFRPMLQDAVNRASENREPWDLQAVIVTANNREIWVRAIGYPVFIDEKLIELRGIFMDIDTIKRNEILLAENEIRFQLAVDAARLGIWDWDLKKNTLKWDRSIYEIFGIDAADYRDTCDAWKKILFKEDAAATTLAIEKALADEEQFNTVFRVISKDGSIKHIMAKGNVTFDVNGAALRMTGVIKNITYEVEAEARIHALNQNLENQVKERTHELQVVTLELEQQLSLLNTSLILSTTDPDGIIQEVNDTLCDISGYTREELIGQNQKILLSPRSLNKHAKIVKNIKQGRYWKGEVSNKRKHGEEFWTELSIKPFYDTDGNLTKLLSISYDITALKNTQAHLSNQSKSLEHTIQQLDVVNKELESFSYSVSHDLKAPLRAIQGFSKNLSNKYADQLDETAVRWLQFIQENAAQMDRLIQDMLAFARISKKQMVRTQTDMRDMIESKIAQFKLVYPAETKIVVHDIEAVPCDPMMMEMVWQNLIENAFKYSSKKPTIEIEIRSEQQDEFVVYSISDKGAGFDMRYYDKLFGVFQRLHSTDEFEGSGVGLASTQRIIQKHGGIISAQSVLGEGTTFEFKLPNK